MKKLLTILMLLMIGSAAYSQGGWTRPNSSYGVRSNRQAIDSALFIPTGCGTPTRLKAYDLKQGALFFDSCNALLYGYNPKDSSWSTVGGGASTTKDSIAAGYLFNIDSIRAHYYRLGVDSSSLRNLIDSLIAAGVDAGGFLGRDSVLYLIDSVVAEGAGGTLQSDYNADSLAYPTIQTYDAGLTIGSGDIETNNHTYIGIFPEVIDFRTNSGFNNASEFRMLGNFMYINASNGSGVSHQLSIQGQKSFIFNQTGDSNAVKFGVGTEHPTAALHVVGAPRFATDSAAAGYVWTAKDNTGQGEWRVASGGGSGITTAQLTDSLNAREPRYKFRDDSTGNAGYTTLFQRNKLKDSLQVNIDLKADTFNQTFTGRNTFTSTTSGVIIPRVTTAQMNAIISPTAGEMVYNTDEGATFYYTTDWGWMSDAPEWKRRSGVEYFSEFILQPTSHNTQTEFFTVILANSGTIGSATAVSNRPGIYQFSTSTSSNARSSIIGSNVLLGGGQLMYETDVQIPTLSNSTETFRFFVGLSNNAQAVSVSSVAFLYDSSGVNDGSAATGNWQVVCANASSRSYTTTSVPVVAGQWYRLKAVVNADATQVQFYIDGTLVRTETSNIPTTGVTPVAVLIKSNGTTARTALIDWFFFKQKFTTQR